MFQKTVNLQSAPAVAGDFASTNPAANVLSPTGGTLVVGATPVTVGMFAWADAAGLVTNAKGSGIAVGFVHREQQALITTWLAETSNLVQTGLPITLMNQGDFWCAFAAGATAGDAVFATDTTGVAQAGPAGTPIVGATETHFRVATTCAAGELAKISSWIA